MTREKDQAPESMAASKPEDGEKAAPVFEVTSSLQFPNWLVEQKISLAFTTYQAGKLFFIGLGPEDRPSFFERTFNRCMGLCVDGDAL